MLLLNNGRWWDAVRFTVEGDAVVKPDKLGVIDCAYEEPTLPARPLPQINDEPLFDFGRYNSLAALPGVRR